MGQRCRPQSFGEVQRCNPPCFLLTAAQYCCSWASLTDQLVRKNSLGINITMKKFFIFVPVQTMKIFFVFVVSSGHANMVRIPTDSNIFFLIFRLMRYEYVFFFSLSGVFFTSEQTIPQVNETVKQDKIREEPENRKAAKAKRPSPFFALKASSQRVVRAQGAKNKTIK